MKKTIYGFLVILAMFAYSCEKDNYPGPDAQISGNILDQNGKPLQTQQGSGNMRIKMEELSWAGDDPSIAITPTYLNMRQNGTYTNTKMFSGTYRMTPVEGPFYPYDAEGEIVEINGPVIKDFTVIPYLDVEWVQEPAVTPDNFITATIRFKRNSKDGVAKPDLNNALLCVATTQYVGNNNYDSQLSGTVSIRNDQEGTDIQLKTTRAVKYTNATYYVRVGVCCNDANKKYNYTTITKLKIEN